MTHPPELVSEIARRYGSIELDNRFPLGKDGQRRPRDRPPGRRPEGRPHALARGALRAHPPLRRLHGGRPHPAPLLDRLGAGRRREPARRGVPDPRRAPRPAARVARPRPRRRGRLRPRRRSAPRRRQPQRLARRPGLPRRTSRPSARLGRRAADRLFELTAARARRAFAPPSSSGFPALRERAYEREEYSAIDWENTRAFAYGTFGNIVVNVRGREANGVVAPGEEYERVRDGIAKSCSTCRGPDGERIVAAVHRREDLFEGPELGKVPDLLVEFDEYAWLGKGNLKSRSESIWDRIEIEPGSEHSYVGSHRHEGLVVLAGPSARPGDEALGGDPGRCTDPALPPRGAGADGARGPHPLRGDRSRSPRAPPARVRGGWRTSAPGRRRSTPTGETEAVEERLRGLGYIE